MPGGIHGSGFIPSDWLRIFITSVLSLKSFVKRFFFKMGVGFFLFPLESLNMSTNDKYNLNINKRCFTTLQTNASTLVTS